MTMAKGIANGYPISAVVTTAPIADAWTGGNISTFGGNPISCAAANATIDVIIDDKLVDNAAAMGAMLREGLDASKAKHTRRRRRARSRTDARHRARARRDGRRPHTRRRGARLRLLEETKKRGLLIGRGGLYGNVLRVAPPLVVIKADVERRAHDPRGRPSAAERRSGSYVPWCRGGSPSEPCALARPSGRGGQRPLLARSGVSPVPCVAHSSARAGAPTQCSKSFASSRRTDRIVDRGGEAPRSRQGHARDRRAPWRCRRGRASGSGGVARAALDGHFGSVHGAVERPGASKGPRDAGEVGRRETALARQRLAVEPDERDHRDDVPRVVLDDAEERARVASPQEVQVASADVSRCDVVDPLEAEDVALESDQPARARATPSAFLVHSTRDVQEIEVGRLSRWRHAAP